MYMKKISIFIVLLLFAGQAEASFYVPKYDRDFIPYNHEEASDANFSSCDDVLESYDDLYDDVDKKMAVRKLGNSSTNRSNFVIDWEQRLFLDEVPVRSFNELKTVTEEAIRDCLVELKKSEKELAEKKQKERVKNKVEKRQIAIQEAISNCDLEFFDHMNKKEKMQTFKERQQCKDRTKNTSTSDTVSTTTNKTDVSTQKLELIQSLMKQVEMLIKQLAELKAKSV